MSFIPTIGQMKHVLKWEKPIKDPDNTGGQDEQYEDWFTGRGYLKKISGVRKFQSGYDESVNVYDGWAVWRHALEAEISKDVRIVFDNRSFSIQHFDLVDEKRRIYKFELKQVR